MGSRTSVPGKLSLLLINHTSITNKELLSKIRHAEIYFAGNRKLKIYGKLNCSSGKRMNQDNRVFFSSKEEAIKLGFRPCGHCMKNEYLEWKKSIC